jgi:hypothetical protein
MTRQAPDIPLSEPQIENLYLNQAADAALFFSGTIDRAAPSLS